MRRLGRNHNVFGGTGSVRPSSREDVFLSFLEARAVGYKNVESFVHYFVDYLDKPDTLQAKLNEIGVRFVTISNGAPMEMHFEDPAKSAKIIEEHMRLVRFIKKLGCSHLKINTGPRRPTGTTDEDLRHMARTLDTLGPRILPGHPCRRPKCAIALLRVVFFELQIDVLPEAAGCQGPGRVVDRTRVAADVHHMALGSGQRSQHSLDCLFQVHRL